MGVIIFVVEIVLIQSRRNDNNRIDEVIVYGQDVYFGFVIRICLIKF